MTKKKRKNGRQRRKNNGNSLFIGDLTIRDVRYDRVFEVHDRELGAALKDLNKYLNDKLQMDTEIRIMPAPPPTSGKFKTLSLGYPFARARGGN